MIGIQPIDSYEVELATEIVASDLTIVYSLYQPLIGIEATHLYMSLYQQYERDKERQMTHYFLLNILNASPQHIFEWRVQLEAIGLLSSFYKDGQPAHYMYRIEKPLSAAHFFEDALLSTFLLSKVGEQTYIQLRSRFTKEKKSMDDYKDITRSFTDVFQPSSIQTRPVLPSSQQFEEVEAQPFKVKNKTFNHVLFRDALSNHLLSEQMIDDLPMDTIETMSYIYSIDALEMVDVLLLAMNRYGVEVTEESIRKAVVSYYKMNRSTKVPTLLPKVKAVEKEFTVNKKEPKANQLSNYFNEVDPGQVLFDLSGKPPVPSILSLVERLINQHQLKMPVVNVLLHYIYLRNNGNISEKFAETIAQHWMNLKVEDAETALQLSKTEHKKYTEWQNRPKQTQKYNSTSRVTREEKVPEWFGKEEQSKTDEQQEGQSKKLEVERLREQLLKELNEKKEGATLEKRQ